MKEELKSVASLISELISNDTFPDSIEPCYLREAVRDYPQRGGKRLRPALVLWACGMLGGNVDLALRTAAALEIYHNWTLVHDDIIDNDLMRRNLPSCHSTLADYLKTGFSCDNKKHAIDFAILAGDIQQGWAVNMLQSETALDSVVRLQMLDRLQQDVCRQLISGEALDVELSLRDIDSISVDEVERMIYKKTAVLLQFCAECGALIALGTDFSDPQVIKCGRFAAALGMSFQLRDDWLGIFGEVEKFGKCIGADLAEGKRTFMMIKALENLKGRKREQLLSLLGHDSYTSDELCRARDLICNSGAQHIVLEKSQALAGECETILRTFPDNRYRQLLIELNTTMLQRET